MQNTYQDLITDLEGKKPQISGKLEGGKKFKIISNFTPAGDQPEAIKKLVSGANKEQFNQVLLGVTGSGKTFTMAKVIEATNRPALILAPNKTLAAQLYGEMKTFFPENAVEYFVSYYDYYTPEAYVPRSDTYIEKEASINEQIYRMRHSATRSLLERDDVLIVAFKADDNVNVNVSFSSSTVSAKIGMLTVLLVSPALNVRVPETDV